MALSQNKTDHIENQNNMKFINNIKNVEVVPESDLKNFLLENVGKNTLVN